MSCDTQLGGYSFRPDAVSFGNRFTVTMKTHLEQIGEYLDESLTVSPLGLIYQTGVGIGVNSGVKIASRPPLHVIYGSRVFLANHGVEN